MAGKTLVFRFSLLTWLLLALWPGEAGADDRRVALVVGVSNYKHAPRLPNTHNDARGTADALRRLGFEVEQLLDPDRDALEAGVRKLRHRAQGAETSLFYYAGHALELGGRNWLLPVAADVQTDRDVRFEGLDLDSILEQMEGASRISLVFMDACRENPFRAKLAATRAMPTRGLARIAPSYGTFVAYATAPGTVALDGTGTNSPFTSALLKFIETPGLELRRLLSQIRGEVREQTQGKQIPWENSALEGDFFFRPPPAAGAAAAAPPTPSPPPASAPPPDREIVFWNSISASRDPADFRAYLAQFPQGIFAELARNRLAQIQTALAPPTPPPPPATPSQSTAPSAPASTPPPSPFREALSTRLAAVASISPQGREDLARNYERMNASRGLAIVPGTTKTWRSGGLPQDRIADLVLEGCQVFYDQPCAIFVTNDKIETASMASQLVPRDMPRARYAGRFDPERIPAARPALATRADVTEYAKAAGPKAAAYHPWGRLFTVVRAADQRIAEEQSLAACNADPDRKGASGPCFLYAVGNKVILPRRFTTPRPQAKTLEEAVALVSPDRNLAANYSAEPNNKAQAIELDSGRSFRWDRAESAKEAERAALEGCQLRYGQPCILLAVNDELKAPDPYTAPRQDMPRIRYDGAFRIEMVPLIWERALPLFREYPARKGNKAIAIRPGPPYIVCVFECDVGRRRGERGARRMQWQDRVSVSMFPVCGERARGAAAAPHRAAPMRRALLFAAIALFAPVNARGQGAILESLDDLKAVPEPPGFRAVLPERAVVPNVPPPRDQAATSSCVSWAVTYAAASQAGRRNGLGSTVTFAPAFTYNQVSGDRTCWSATSTSKTLDPLRDAGTLPIEEFAFDAGWCGRVPTRGRTQTRPALSHQGMEPVRCFRCRPREGAARARRPGHLCDARWNEAPRPSR